MKKLNLAFIGTQPVTHIVRHASHVQGTVAVGKNLLGTVVTSNNDKAIIGIEDVIVRQTRTVITHLGIEQFDVTSGGAIDARHGVHTLKITLSVSLSCHKVNGSSPALSHSQHQGY